MKLTRCFDIRLNKKAFEWNISMFENTFQITITTGQVE